MPKNAIPQIPTWATCDAPTRDNNQKLTSQFDELLDRIQKSLSREPSPSLGIESVSRHKEVKGPRPPVSVGN